jgi:hypothetical protein
MLKYVCSMPSWQQIKFKKCTLETLEETLNFKKISMNMLRKEVKVNCIKIINGHWILLNAFPRFTEMMMSFFFSLLIKSKYIWLKF